MGKSKIKNKYIAYFKVWIQDSYGIVELRDNELMLELPSVEHDYLQAVVKEKLENTYYRRKKVLQQNCIWKDVVYGFKLSRYYKNK